jgi:hypothetical protein
MVRIWESDGLTKMIEVREWISTISNSPGFESQAVEEFEVEVWLLKEK